MGEVDQEEDDYVVKAAEKIARNGGIR